MNANHPGEEAFDGGIARFLTYERLLNAREMEQTLKHLNSVYSISGE